MIEGVAWARVHIVTPKRTLFKSDAEGASASVALRIKPGYRLSGSSIAAITHLVAGSVEALKAENVTIIDNQGRLLNGDAGAGTVASGATGVQDYRERIEQNLSAKVEEMLEEVLGPGRASVRVSAVVDMNSANIVTETYDPKGVPIREEIASESETKPGAVANDGSGSAPAANKKSETITTEMSVGKTVRQETIAPGKIKDLKVAAFVDLSPADANSTGPLMAVSDVEQIIRNALGLDNSSDLKVVDVPFNRPAEPEIVEAGGGLDFIALAGQASLGIMAVCALLALKILGAGKKGSVKGAQQAPALTAGDAENAQAKTHALEAAHREEIAGLLASGEQQIDEDKPQEIRKQIAGVFRKHPDEVKQLFSHWLTQGE